MATTINKIRTFKQRKGQGQRAKSKGYVVSVERLTHLENAQCGAKSVTSVAIKITSVHNVRLSSQEPGTESPAAHPEDARAEVSHIIPGLEASWQPKVPTAWSQPPFKTIQMTSMEKTQTTSMEKEQTSIDILEETSMEPPFKTIQEVLNFLKSFSTISRSKSVASLSNDTDPEGKTKILTMLQLKLPHCKGIDDITVKVDDGAEGNILPLNSFRAMFPHALDANGYPKPGFLRGSKMTFECYDDGKLINHGSIKLKLQHYSEKSFHDHSFYVVETKTLKPIIIGHPASIRLGLIQVLCKNISKSVLVIEKSENSIKNSFQDHRLRIDSKTPWRHQRSKSESLVHSFQDHLGNHHGDKQDGHKCPNKDSFKTIHQKSGKSVLSRPSTKCVKNGPKSGSSKAIKPQKLHKKGSFKTIEDGSKNDTSFKTIGENGQKSTPFKTIVNRVKNLNPQYMVHVDEVSQVIPDPKSRKKAQPVTEQLSSGPPPPGS